ncbi:gustatory receptor 68a-like [Tribolium madens]|uniref:gustatory receptor 68a-like n=1 Tax=Tribolium madens TaxID=41895 RepID=UPI001CF743B0|nr:gustatory receptor 68a-like [Tribolium madens]
MNYLKLSTKDIRSLDLIYKIITVFGISPSYDFKHDKIIYPNVTRFYGFVLSTFLIVLQFVSMQDSFKYLNRSELITSKIVSFVNGILLVMSVLTMILSSFIFNQKKWSSLNKNFQFVDKKLNNRNSKSRIFYENFNFQYGFILTLFVLGQIYVFCSVIHSEVMFKSGYWLHQICHICEVNTIFLVCSILTIFKIRYSDLNKIFQSNKISVGLIRDTAVLYRLLGDNVANFNKIFGWSLIFLFGRIVLQLLSSLEFLLYSSRKQFKFEGISTTAFIVLNYSVFVYTLVSVILIIMGCDVATSNSRKTAELCYKLQSFYPQDAPQRKELLRFASESRGSVAKFTAADFFEIDRGTFFGILSTTTSYFIILIQFNTKKLFVCLRQYKRHK